MLGWGHARCGVTPERPVCLYRRELQWDILRSIFQLHRDLLGVRPPQAAQLCGEDFAGAVGDPPIPVQRDPESSDAVVIAFAESDALGNWDTFELSDAVSKRHAQRHSIVHQISQRDSHVHTHEYGHALGYAHRDSEPKRHSLRYAHANCAERHANFDPVANGKGDRHRYAHAKWDAASYTASHAVEHAL